MTLFDSSILNKVKKRLQGDDSTGPVAGDTQVINFNDSVLFAEPAMTKDASPEKDIPASQKPLRLPQLALDMSDFVPPASASTQNLAGSTQIIPQADTQANIDASLQDAQSKVLTEEIIRESLTDEELELNDVADTTRDSSVQRTITTKAELFQIEKELSEAKRMKNIQPIFEKHTINPVEQLMNAFESESESESRSEAQAPKSSPVTSPLKIAKDIDLSASDTDAEFDTANVLDLLERPAGPLKKKKSPIDDYAQKLKRQLFSSPTGDKIVLELSGSESVHEEPAKEIPDLSKEQAFLIKQKFSRKQLGKNRPFGGQSRAGTGGKNLFDALRRANAKQLTDLRKANPDAELLEEIEQEEEVMGTLLEREMERVRKIRKREKLAEKARKALLENEDADYNVNKPDEGSENGSEVPDSDVDSSLAASDSSDDENLSNEDESIQDVPRGPRFRRAVITDDEEEGGDSAEESPHSQTATPRPDERSDDSYMFGGQVGIAQQDDQDESIMRIHSDLPQPDSPEPSRFNQSYEADKSSHTLFSNLPPQSETQQSIVESTEAGQKGPDFSFHELEATQDSLISNGILPTQVDTQPTTQQHLAVPSQIVQQSDGEEDYSVAVEKGRQLVRGNVSQDANVPTDNEEADQLNEEEMKQQVALYEARIRRKELKARKRRKEMERRGLKGVIEGEAEESDDEWKGIGGKDNEDSDQANSDDERMIDNNFNIDLNDEEVRKKFMEQYQIKDRNELEKLIDDIKNHKLTRRARSNRFDVELSDEEDELLLAYRRQKLEEQKQRLLANQKAMSSTKSEKSKAFFDSMHEESPAFVLEESDASDPSMSEPENKENTDEAPQLPVKKTIKLKEEFVQRQLSFLSKTEDDRYERIQIESNRQHDVDDGDDLDDVAALKHKSLASLYSKSQSQDSLVESAKRTLDYASTDDDEDDVSRVFKKPSVVSSFRSYHEKQGAQISTSFSGVTVNKQYKAASGSKASITYMSKTKKQKEAPSFRSSRAQEIEEKVEDARKSSGIFKSGSIFS